ncbi:hypothetical protein OG729_00800 [Streptomyces sp. NBC_00210]|uniref:hypothetical protein n=1 Tax=unclassified Streptomyces TaxID=2593676 RepID=UPI00324967E7
MLAAASACSPGGNDSAGKVLQGPSTSSAAPSRSTTPADPAEAAKADAIDTYKRYWQEMERLYVDSTGKGANLKPYAAAAALINAEADAKSMHGRGLVVTGEVAVGSPTVTKIDINRKIPNVTLSSCLDISRWQVIHSKTKKPAALPTERLTKYVIVSTIERWPEGWRVIKDEPQEQNC